MVLQWYCIERDGVCKLWRREIMFETVLWINIESVMYSITLSGSVVATVSSAVENLFKIQVIIMHKCEL